MQYAYSGKDSHNLQTLKHFGCGLLGCGFGGEPQQWWSEKKTDIWNIWGCKRRISREFRRIQEIDIKRHEASTKLVTELDSWTENQQALVACCVSRARLVGSGSGTQSASGGGSIHPIGTVRNLKSSQIWQHPRWLIGFRKYYSIWNHHVNITHITLCTSLSLLLDIPTNTIKIHH